MVRVAEPDVASVPAWKVVRYCELLRPSLSIKYYPGIELALPLESFCWLTSKKSMTSALKAVIVSPLVAGRKDQTAFAPLEPLYKSLYRRVEFGLLHKFLLRTHVPRIFADRYVASNRDGLTFRVILKGNGARLIVCHPNHDLIGGSSVSSVCGEEIVRYITNRGFRVVHGPGPWALNGADSVQLLVHASIKLHAGEALDTGASNPLPGGGPGDGVTVDGSYGCTVRARCSISKTPLVKKELVVPISIGIPLAYTSGTIRNRARWKTTWKNNHHINLFVFLWAQEQELPKQ